MEKLKTQLLMLGRDRGDTGDINAQRTLIEAYLAVLEVYLTPEGIESFTVDQLREGYIAFSKLFAEKLPKEELVHRFGLCLHIREFPRLGMPMRPPSSTTVVDIFSRKH